MALNEEARKGCEGLWNLHAEHVKAFEEAAARACGMDDPADITAERQRMYSELIETATEAANALAAIVEARLMSEDADRYFDAKFRANVGPGASEAAPSERFRN